MIDLALAAVQACFEKRNLVDPVGPSLLLVTHSARQHARVVAWQYGPLPLTPSQSDLKLGPSVLLNFGSALFQPISVFMVKWLGCAVLKQYGAIHQQRGAYVAWIQARQDD